MDSMDSTDYIRLKGYCIENKLCFDIKLDSNMIILEIFLKGLPQYETFSLIDTSHLGGNETLCTVTRQYAEYAIEFLSSLMMIETIRKQQKTGFERLIVGSNDIINDYGLKDKISSLNFENLSTEDWIELHIASIGRKDGTANYLRNWSETSKNFKVEFTFEEAMPDFQKYELYVRNAYT